MINLEPPCAAFFSAANQTDVVIDLNEAEVEEQSKEQEAQMVITESLD